MRDPKINISCVCLPNCLDLKVLIDSTISLSNNADLLGSSGAIITYKAFPTIKYKRKILFSIEDLWSK